MRRGGKLTRRIRGVLVSLAAVVMALGPATACGTETPMTQAQMACCIAMGHDCSAAGQKEDCCPTDTQGAQYVVIVKSASSQAPAALPQAWVPTPAPSSLAALAFEGRTLLLKGPPLRGRTVPTYLRVSSLLI